MKPLVSLLLSAAFLSSATLFSADEGRQPADIAAPKLDDKGELQTQFAKLHEGYIAIGRTRNPEVIFLGDSITLGWSINGKEVFKEFDKYNVANFGIFGDRVQNILWRVENEEFDGVTPKVVVLMVGTNNAPVKENSPEEIASGIRKIIDSIHSKSPETRILLRAIFPRGADPSDKNRQKNEEVNALIAKYDDGKTVHFLNINDKLLQPDGALDATIMPDFLHPSEAGYRIVADAIREKLDSLVK